MTDDPEYQRLMRLRADAIERGNDEAAIAYGNAAVRRGDELIVARGGKALFGPICDALENLRRV